MEEPPSERSAEVGEFVDLLVSLPPGAPGPAVTLWGSGTYRVELLDDELCNAGAEPYHCPPCNPA